jgi:hypothetical protein
VKRLRSEELRRHFKMPADRIDAGFITKLAALGEQACTAVPELVDALDVLAAERDTAVDALESVIGWLFPNDADGFLFRWPTSESAEELRRGIGADWAPAVVDALVELRPEKWQADTEGIRLQ